MYNADQWVRINRVKFLTLQGNMTTIFALSSLERYAWPCTARYEFQTSLVRNFTITRFSTFTSAIWTESVADDIQFTVCAVLKTMA